MTFGRSPNGILVILYAAFLAVLIVSGTDAQYLNGPAPAVTSAQFCAEIRGWVGMSRQGHTLRSISCHGGGRHFTVDVTID